MICEEIMLLMKTCNIVCVYLSFESSHSFIRNCIAQTDQEKLFCCQEESKRVIDQIFGEFEGVFSFFKIKLVYNVSPL